MAELKTFSELLEQETRDWIDAEIRRGNDAWNARRAIHGLSNIHWNMVTRAAAGLKEHLADDGQNMSPGLFVCRCIQKHRPELLKKSDGTTVKTNDLVYCKPEELKPWSSAARRVAAENLAELCRKEIGCENPGTDWSSILKRDVAHRRAGERQEAYRIAFLLRMTMEEMQRYFFLTRQEAFSLRDPLDVVCYTFKLFDKGKDHADSFRWQDVTDVLQEYLDACKEADAKVEAEAEAKTDADADVKADAEAAPDAPQAAQRGSSTILLGSDIQELQDEMHRANDPDKDIPALKKALKDYLLIHRRSLVDMAMERVQLSPDQSRVEIGLDYPYSHTVQTELSVLVGYLLVLYGCWNDLVEEVYPKKPERREALMLPEEEGAEPKLLTADDFREVLSSGVVGRTGNDTLGPLRRAFRDRLDPDTFAAVPEDKASPQVKTTRLMGQWLLRIALQEAETPEEFKEAAKPLNDFLRCVNGKNSSFAPPADYQASARETSAAVWSLAGIFHCKGALSARVASQSPKADSPSASDWAEYLSALGQALIKVADDPDNFRDRELRGILNNGQHDALQKVFTSLSSYDLGRESYSENKSEATRYRRVQEHLEMSLPNLSDKIGFTLGRYYPKAEEHASRKDQTSKEKLLNSYKNNGLGSNLLTREDILQLFFFLILALYDCYAKDRDKKSEDFTPEHVWLEAMYNRAHEKMAGLDQTTGSCLEDALFASVYPEIMCLLDEPETDGISKDWANSICRIYNFLLEGLSQASGTSYHSIYYPAYVDRFYVLAGALATAIPQSRRTLGFMMGAQRDQYMKPKKKSEKEPAEGPDKKKPDKKPRKKT